MGILSKEGELFALEMDGPLKKMVLVGGPGIDEIGKKPDLLGTRLRVSGKLHPFHADKPPGITVIAWESCPS